MVEGNTDSEGEAEVDEQSSDDDGTKQQYDGYGKSDESNLLTNQHKMEFFTRVDEMSLAQQELHKELQETDSAE